jgi:DNA recombination protein RmuC
MSMEILAPAISIIVLLFTILIWIKIRQPFGQDLHKTIRDELRESRDETARQARDLREEVANTQAKANEVLVRMVNILGDDQKNLLGKLTQANEERLDQVRSVLDEKLRQVMEDQRKHLADVIAALKSLESSQLQEQGKARDALDLKFTQIQESNEKKLDEMRKTVDEKLHSTLEKRLGESFKLVSERLEAVQRGLGEMQTLATGVGDLKRVLGNVKERGTWGEYQLGAILSEVLTPDQYARNVRTKDGRESVEYAIRLPGKGQDHDAPVWLPVDSKFPREAYERLVDAARVADADGVESASIELRKAVIKMAKDIQDKYINPPTSTDFAILFLPTEGLYAEVLRQSGLHDELQQKHRVLVAGPTTLSAILNSLRVGFQTIAIEKRASEVWTVLGAVKTEFGKFGDVLERVKKQINTVSNTLDESTKRTRAMEKKLRSVEQLPADQARSLLAISEAEPVSTSDDDSIDEPSGK